MYTTDLYRRVCARIVVCRDARNQFSLSLARTFSPSLRRFVKFMQKRHKRRTKDLISLLVFLRHIKADNPERKRKKERKKVREKEKASFGLNNTPEVLRTTGTNCLEKRVLKRFYVS
jgi:hypothetical protein